MKPSRPNPSNQTQETGQGFVEYALILILVGIAVVLVVTLMQPAIGDVFSRFVAQAPVAPPSLLNYTPPPTFTNTPTVDPSAPATNTQVPPAPTNTSAPPTETNTSVPASATNTGVPPTITNTPSPTPCPIPNSSHTVPALGSVRIQIEDFRCGGAGVAFFDQTNDGGSGSGSYRSDVGNEGPDLQTAFDSTGGNLNVGWTRDGEWIEFDISAPRADTYTFIIRNASQSANPQMQIRTTSAVSGAQLNTGTINFGPTGGWQNWQNTSVNVGLYEGRNFVRFNIISGSGNFNYFDIVPFVPTATPTPVTPTATPIPTNTPIPTATTAPVTLTLYSNASHDGDVREQGGSNSGGTTNNGRGEIYVGDDNTNNNRQYIGIVSFDTSSIPVNATITNIQLRLQQESIVGSPFGELELGDLYADIAPFNGFNNSYSLQSEDFEALATTTNVIRFSQPTGDGAWASGLLGASQYPFVNRGAYTQFKIHFLANDNDNRSSDQFRFYSGNSSNPPQLIITYTVP